MDGHDLALGVEFLAHAAHPHQHRDLDEQRPLGRREAGADAPAEPKGREPFQVRVLRQRLLVRRRVLGLQPAARVEALGVRVDRLVLEHGVLVPVQDGAWWNVVPAIAVCAGRDVRDACFGPSDGFR